MHGRGCRVCPLEIESAGQALGALELVATSLHPEAVIAPTKWPKIDAVS